METEIRENTGKNKFTVVCGGCIPQEIMQAVRRELNKLKPAHLIYQIVTEVRREAAGKRYLAAKAAMMKTYEIYEIKEGI